MVWVFLGQGGYVGIAARLSAVYWLAIAFAIRHKIKATEQLGGGLADVSSGPLLV
jgi:hypothetical protein